jgi:alginate O-acetyltransferase complex protein AlgI
LGRLFGFAFPNNFLRPYESLNPKDFWRRWHTTLSYWIRDYLYIPLGGRERYLRNILIVFAATGLWHGAGWNFIAWGIYHGCLVLGYSVVSPLWDRIPPLAQRLATFLFVSFGWLLFLFDFDGAFLLARSLLGLGAGTLAPPNLAMWGLVGLGAVICFGVRFEKFVASGNDASGRSIARIVGVGLLLGITLLFFDQSKTFIYFRF